MTIDPSQMSRKIATRVALALVMCIALLTGCAKGSTPARTDTPKESKPAQVQPSDFFVGNIELGESQESVLAKFGQPDQVDVIRGPGIPFWRYSSRGLGVGFFSGKNKPPVVVYVSAIPGFAGSTPRGISIGSSADAVLKAYGELTVRSGNDVLSFGMKDGKVLNIAAGRSFDPFGSGNMINLAAPEN